MPDVRPSGTWPSPVTARMVARAQRSLGSPAVDRGRIFWVEHRPQEEGRPVLVCREPDGTVREATTVRFGTRSRVHEYGGTAYAADGDTLVAIGDADQRLYRLRQEGKPEALSPDVNGRLRYAEPLIDPFRRRVIAVCEDHRRDGEPENGIVVLPLDRQGAPEWLARGHDFFAWPRLSPDGRELAWIAWDRPDMPWDSTALFRARLDGEGRLAEVRRIAGGSGESVLQPEWSSEGELFCLSDRSGYWNLYRVTDAELQAVCPLDAECGGPLWQLGARWYALLAGRRIVLCGTRDGFSRLLVVDVATGACRPLPLPYDAIGELASDGGRLVCLAAAADRPTTLVEIDPASGRHRELVTAGELPVDPSWISRPTSFAFESVGGRPVRGFLYAPVNPQVKAPADALPPAIVRAHGGPTGAASPALKLAYQFWTSRGFVVLDVDYAGSTGYGRAFREALYGRWGIADAEDVVEAGRALGRKALADPRRLVVAGSSAGGFTALCALAFHDGFAAGSIHYGIGDLEALARDTHKFESRYLDRLVGPWPERADLYRARSPVRHADRISAPVVFFQGREDRVVPPEQAEAMVRALRRNGVDVALHMFDGEGHGFRGADTVQRVLEAEHAFLGRALGFAQ